jgi:NADH-quinone oxidoreductase subunit C
LLSMERRDRLRIKVGVPETDLTVPSMTAVWSTANWFEREIFDMFGITFTGHPDLRRILMPDDWEGYPLRRDEPIGGEEVAFTS